MKKRLSYNQFRVLTRLANGGGGLGRFFLAEELDMRLSLLDEIIHTLLEKRAIYLVEEETHDTIYCITSRGFKYLKPYEVKRAVLLAAGLGTRLHPITVNTPKPLVRVKNVPIVERLIKALISAGVSEIVIVRGHLKEQFDYLKSKYSQVKFIDNPDYESSNNISSVFYARDHLENCYIIESDLCLNTPSLITKYQYSSNYLGVPVSSTEDWCFTMNGDFIKEQVVGGKDCYLEVGLSYWSKEDGKKLARHLSEAYINYSQKNMFWDEIVFNKYPEDYKVRIRPCTSKDITEIDTFEELEKIDPTYLPKSFLFT